MKSSCDTCDGRWGCCSCPKQQKDWQKDEIDSLRRELSEIQEYSRKETERLKKELDEATTKLEVANREIKTLKDNINKVGNTIYYGDSDFVKAAIMMDLNKI